jgi:lipopolysaccharide/colanic/teichoic acid biosynthesis glycosyltransferase
MLVIAGVIRLDSPGRAVFIQRRIGKDGRPFMVYKFRTMVQDAEELLHSSPEMQKQYRKSFKLGEDDSRLTRFGRILRRTSMDELPQLINVLRGEMSLVGPRPREEEEVQEHFVGLESKLLSVKPGITGYWQVRGRNGIDYPKRVDVELYYIDNRSLRLDLAILGWTVTAVLTGRGAV